MHPRLKLYLGDESNGYAAPADISMNLAEFVQIIQDAKKWDSTWLRDFSDDEIRISSDLYDVLSMYSSMRPSA
jgi:hypothetical protein